MIVVGTTVCGFVMGQENTWASWMRNAEAIKASHPEGVEYFATIQTDVRGLSPFWPFVDRLTELGGRYWTFSLDDGRTEITTWNRLRHSTTGLNLVADHAYQDHANCSHLLFLAADVEPPADVLPKLLEVNYPVVAPFMSTYVEHGFGAADHPDVPGYPFPVKDTVITTSAMLIARRILQFVRWRWDAHVGCGDDHCFLHDLGKFHDIHQYMRMDCVARHFPERITSAGFHPSLRERGHTDLRVYR